MTTPKILLKLFTKDSQLHLSFNRGNYMISLSPETKSRFFVDKASWVGVEFIFDDKRIIGLNLLEQKLKVYSKLNNDL